MRLSWRKTRITEAAFEEGRAAARAGSEHLAQAREREHDVRQVAARLKEIRQSNHFSERIAAMLREEPGGRHAPHA